MNSINSSHAAGHAAYTRQTHSSQEAEQAQSSEEADAASSKQDAPKDTFQSTAQSTAEDDLSAQEREMIKDNFPEDPELSMRLYGRSRDAQTVNPDTLGNNLDMTG